MRKLRQQFRKPFTLVIFFQSLDILLDARRIAAIEYGQVEIAKDRQHGDVKMGCWTRLAALLH